MLVGNARVPTQDQKPVLQLDALTVAGCKTVFTEKAFGAKRDWPELAAALSYMRPGHSLASGNSIVELAPCPRSSRLSPCSKQTASACALHDRGD